MTSNLHWCSSFQFKLSEKLCKDYKYDDIDVAQMIRKTSYERKIKNSVGNWKAFTGGLLTFFGICSSYNLMDLKMIYENETHEDLMEVRRYAWEYGNETEPNWSPEKGFKDENSSQIKRINGAESCDFFLPLSAEEDENYCFSKRFLVYIHKPNEIITRYHKPIFVHHGDKIEIYVVVKSLRTDPALRSFPIDVRKCYFEGERKLKFFKTYTKALCEWECFTNKTLAQCGCVRFSMPRNQATKVCNATKIKNCANSVRRKSCDCYALCNDVEYTWTTESFQFKKEIYARFFPNA